MRENLGRLALLAALAGAAPLGAAPVELTATGAGLDLRAEAAPLDEVLEAIAARTGMELDWPRPRPRPLVTAELAGLTVAELIPRLMQGLRFNYAMKLGADGRVALLVVLDAVPLTGEVPQALPPGKRRPRLDPPPLPAGGVAEERALPVRRRGRPHP